MIKKKSVAQNSFIISVENCPLQKLKYLVLVLQFFWVCNHIVKLTMLFVCLVGWVFFYGGGGEGWGLGGSVYTV